MLTPLATILDTAHMEAMVKSILKNSCHRAYVMSSTSLNLVGVVSPKDVISVITGHARNSGASELQIKYDKLLIELQDLESRLETQRKMVLDSPLMMHSVDRKGVIRMANRALHNCLGYEYGELLGKTIFNLYPHNQHESVRIGLDVVLQTGFHDLVETAMVSKDQHLVKVEVDFVILFGQPRGADWNDHCQSHE